jgi:hypothetical protein
VCWDGGFELDEMAQQVLTQAHLYGRARPQPDAEAASKLDAADTAAEPARPAEAAADDPEIDDGLEIGLD